MAAGDLFDIRGRVALVTGGTGVLGRALAAGLAEAGCRVAVASRALERAEAVARALPGDAMGVAMEATNRTDVETAIASVERRLGPIDILVNGAGGNDPRATAGDGQSFFDLPADALRAAVDVNLFGTLLPCQVVGRSMAARRAGVILNISSMTATRPLTRVVGYGAAKAAVDNFTRWLAVYVAREFGPAIRVNALAPGFFETEQNRFLLHDPADARLTERGHRIIAHTPMGRFGQPEDLVGAMLWLVSPAARFVTGTVVAVDGGFSAYAGV